MNHTVRYQQNGMNSAEVTRVSMRLSIISALILTFFSIPAYSEPNIPTQGRSDDTEVRARFVFQGLKLKIDSITEVMRADHYLSPIVFPVHCDSGQNLKDRIVIGIYDLGSLRSGYEISPAYKRVVDDYGKQVEQALNNDNVGLALYLENKRQELPEYDFAVAMSVARKSVGEAHPELRFMVPRSAIFFARHDPRIRFLDLQDEFATALVAETQPYRKRSGTQ
jgi:hypothetical protein